MAHATDPNDIDPKELERAQTLWGNFAEATKYMVFAAAAILSLLALVFVF